MTSGANSNEWFILEDGGKSRPISVAEIRQKISRGELAPQTQVWSQALNSWKPISELGDVFGEVGVATVKSSPKKESSTTMWHDDHDVDQYLDSRKEGISGHGDSSDGSSKLTPGSLAAALVVVAVLGLFAYHLWGPSHRHVPVLNGEPKEVPVVEDSASPVFAAAIGAVAAAPELTLGPVPASSHGSDLEVHVLNVGQGDGVLLRLPSGEYVLYDAGLSDGTGVVPYLLALGIKKIKALVISHPHADHVGGAFLVLKNFDVETVYDCGATHTIQAYRRMLEEIDRQEIDYVQPRAGEQLSWDTRLRVTVLHPDRTDYKNLNNSSIVLHVTYDSVSVLLTGDAEHEAEERIVGTFGDQIAAQILKVGHHGSRSSSTPGFLGACRPEFAAISCGRLNSYGHPHAETLRSLESVNAEILRTDQQGFLIFRTDGQTIFRSTSRNPLPKTLDCRVKAADFTAGKWLDIPGSDSNQVIRKRAGIEMKAASGFPTSILPLQRNRNWDISVSTVVRDGSGYAGLAINLADETYFSISYSAGGMVGLFLSRSGEEQYAGKIGINVDRLGARRKGNDLEFIVRDGESGEWHTIWILNNELKGVRELSLGLFTGKQREETTATFSDLSIAYW